MSESNRRHLCLAVENTARAAQGFEAQPDRYAANLRQAAELVETTAFDAALSQNPSMIARMIAIASDLERLSWIMEAEQDADDSGPRRPRATH